MNKFNPDFWEVIIESAGLDQFKNEDALWFESAEDKVDRHNREDMAKNLALDVARVAPDLLTPRQLDVFNLYFFKGLNQRQIAEYLNMTQQTVGEHLYGKMRNGHRIGGALRKIRKVCRIDI